MLTAAVCSLFLAQNHTLYRVDELDSRGKPLFRNLPVEEWRWLQLHHDKKMYLRDLNVAFAGTWEKDGKNIKLKIVSGKPPETQVWTLVPVKPNVYEYRKPPIFMRFTYDPGFMKRMGDEILKKGKKSGG